MGKRHICALGAAALWLAPAAQAAVLIFGAELSGLNEVPANISAGTGSGVVTFDDGADTLRIKIDFAGLTGTTTVAHIHCCVGPDGNAGVATTIPSFPDFPAGVTSGGYDRTFSLADITFYNPAFIASSGGTVDLARAALITGLSDRQAYLNIHTTDFPAGEMRGQLAAVPETATWMMMIAGFGLVGGAIRSRRTTSPDAHRRQ